MKVKALNNFCRNAGIATFNTITSKLFKKGCFTVRKNRRKGFVYRIKLTEKQLEKIFKNSLAFLKQSGYNEAMHKHRKV